MKKLFLFLAMASTTMFVSCGSDDNGGGTPAATSVTLTSSATAVNLGQPVTLTAKDNNGADVTSTAVFYDGTTVITSPYTATTPGTHSLTAKLGTLTSAAVVVTVSVPANTLIVNGTSGVADKSMLYYLGSTESGANVFVANPYNQVGEGEAATYPNDVYVYFTSIQDPEATSITLPELGNYEFGLVTDDKVVFDANVFFNSQEVLATEITNDAKMELTRFTATAEDESYAFTYSIKLANNTFAHGSYDGAFTFSNEAARTAARGTSTDMKVVTVTPAELQANFKAVMAKKK